MFYLTITKAFGNHKLTPDMRWLYENESMIETIGVLHACCVEIESWGGMVFTVSGFGSPPKVFPIKPELVILLDQIPDLYRGLSTQNNYQGTISFYEQGCRVTVNYRRNDANVEVEYYDHDHQLLGGKEKAVASYKVEDILRMLSSVTETFVHVVEQLRLPTYKHPLFVQWCRDVGIGETSDRNLK